MKPKMKKFIKSSLDIQLNIWTIYKSGQQGKSTKQFTYSDNRKKKIFGSGLSKKNKKINNKSIINPNKTNHKNPIIFT